MKAIRLAVLSLLLSGCSWFGGDDSAQQGPQTLADMQLELEPLAQVAPQQQKPEVDELITHYQQLLTLDLDANTKQNIAYRLADLQMIASEDKLVTDNADLIVFNQTIEEYQRLLQQFPQAQHNEHTLYQLAKAYELSGQTENAITTLEQLLNRYPMTEYQAEAEFRRGEYYYARKDYLTAADAYRAVIQIGPQNRYYSNALFMMGWTEFKLSEHLKAQQQFVKLLDLQLAENGKLQDLPRAQQSLVDDTFRIMSLMFSFSQDSAPIEKLLATTGNRDYQTLLYKQFSQLLLTQQRYTDAVNQLQHFVDNNPQSPWSFEAHIQMMQILVTAKLPKEVLAAKQQFVERYAVSTAYFESLEQEPQDKLRQQLTAILDELASYYHSLAQRAKSKSDKSEHLASAISYYQDFLITAPEHESIAEKHYLLAEALFDSQQFEQAIKHYRVAAYQFQQIPKRQSAGYAVIVSFEQLAKQQPERIDALTDERIAEQLKFAESFAPAQQALEMQQKSATDLFNLKRYDQAQLVAQQLLDWPTNYPQISLAQTTRYKMQLINAHSAFFLQDYLYAQAQYESILLLIDKQKQKSDLADIQERLAASIYKQGEQKAAQQQYAEAIALFLQVGQSVPSASIVATATFDAGNLAYEQKLWQQAIAILSDFKAQYPQNQLSKSIPAKLAIAFEQNGQLAQAADAYWQLSQQSSDPELKRDAHFQAASLYEKQGLIEQAIVHYRSYAHAYPEPFDTAMEVRFKLSEFYQKTNEPSKRRFWLNKLIQYDADAGSQRSGRSRFLAAYASTIFAEDARVAFNNIKLKLPLKKSLARKKKAMQKAIKALEKVNGYNIADFATEATYKIGQIYTQLSKDILESDRPKLDELALEQYNILLEEQAYPFEEYAIEIHEANSQRAWQGVYDDWVKNSFKSLEKLLPARFAKKEQSVEVIDYAF